MLIVRQTIDRITMEILLLAFHEPMIIRLIKVFYILSALRQLSRSTPSSCTTTTRFLSNSQGYTLIESTTIECHLTSVRAARHTNMLGINLCNLRPKLLQTINQATQTPGPFTL